MFDFTVFTPTYNRRHTLTRVYESLLSAGSVSFEWLIIDDGSIDGTADLVKELSRRSSFPIIYQYKENQGKHTAHNFALELARGRFFIVLDSDDELYPGALLELLSAWNQIADENLPGIAGILGNSVDEHGMVVGSPYPEDGQDAPHFFLHAAGIMVGDKLPCYRLDVLKEHPFPQLSVRTVVPEGVVWHKIGRSYLVRCKNITVRKYNKSANDESSLMNSYVMPSSNAFGKLLYSRTVLDWSSPYFLNFPILFIKHAVYCTRFSLHSGESPLGNLGRVSILNKFILLISMPVGFAFWVFDKFSSVSPLYSTRRQSG
jgi:glycosyltransferase involved in cell wall biosynthesis